MTQEIIRFHSEGATHRLIFLHGWGADANDLIPIGEELLKGLSLNIELIFFNAPEEHPQGSGRQWYSLFPPAWESVPQAVLDLQNRFKAIESNSISFEKTFLFGFSQGGAMALASGVELPFAAIICCSGYPHPIWDPPSDSPPILLTHGKKDDVVPVAAFNKLVMLLDSNQDRFESHLFKGGHEITLEVIDKIRLFIAKYI